MGNCLGLTLLLGAELSARGFEPEFELCVNPRDDVYSVGEQYFDRLIDEDQGVDYDSRLPEARDCTSRFRFAPAEHAMMRLRDARGEVRPFEATGLWPDRVFDDPGWETDCESVRSVRFGDLASCLYAERSKALLGHGDWDGDWDGDSEARMATLLALRAVRMWPDNREAWAQVWEAARMLALLSERLADRCQGIADLAARRYLALAGDDSLWNFTAFRMTGAISRLDTAIEIFPAHAEAYHARYVATLVRPGMDDDDRERAGRAFIISAWMHAESELHDLHRFYREHAAELAELFSADEVADLLATFSEPQRGESVTGS